jgi:glycerate dehydrogenase
MRIVVLDGYTLNPGDLSWGPVEALGELEVFDRTSQDELIARAKGAEVLLTNKTVLDAQAIAALPELRYIGVLATGYNVVDVDAAAKRRIPVTNVPEYSTSSVAQLVFALLLELCHQVGEHSRAVIQGGLWAESRDFSFTVAPLVELEGLKMGIVGFGRTGQRTGALAHAFGMDVIVNSRTRDKKVGYPFGWRELDALFAEADVVSLHCPLTPETNSLVNARLLDRMKRSAFLINTSRGPVVNERDLADALEHGKLAGAAVDVLSTEPPSRVNPLLSAPNIIITPHIAWATKAARVRLMDTAAQNLSAWKYGKLINVVNGVG